MNHKLKFLSRQSFLKDLETHMTKIAPKLKNRECGHRARFVWNIVQQYRKTMGVHQLNFLVMFALQSFVSVDK